MTIPPQQLKDKDFIQNEPGKWNIPTWVWFFLLLLFCGLLMQFFVWFWHSTATVAVPQPPFYQVTNREMSLYLWQNGDLRKPLYQTENADQLAIATPEQLFRYHTWNRLLKSEFTNTPVPADDFMKFLSEMPEWLPTNWPAAPDQYKALLLSKSQPSDLSTQLPLEVRIAFQGWKNLSQKDEIDKLQPTKEQIEKFLLAHPHYARNYWRNIEPGYLGSLSAHDSVPDNEVPAFLRQAIFNAQPSK